MATERDEHVATDSVDAAATGVVTGRPAPHAVALFRARVAASGPRPALKRKAGGTWTSTTWAEWDAASREIAAGLLDAGVAPGDRVCILAQTRVEWALCDVGIVMAGAVAVPIYPSNTPDQCAYVIGDSGAKLVFAEDPLQIEKLFAPVEAAKLAGVRFVVWDAESRFDKPDRRGRLRLDLADAVPASERTRVGMLADLRAAGRAWLAANPGALERRWEAVRGEDLFTIVYTSGTTGPPKGVVLTHGNICFECAAMGAAGLPIGEDDEQLLFLPLAHIFAKILLWSAIDRGVLTSFAEGIPQVAANMKEVRPTFMGSVPRIYEKVYAKVVSGAEETGGLKRKAFRWAMGVGRRVSVLRRRGERPAGLLAAEHAIADRLVFAKLRAAFGGRLRFFISGGAPLGKEIAEFFHAAGVLILEGYGLTETTAATHVNRPDRYRFGTVGPALPGVDVTIAGDGEILVRGPNIMSEYWGQPEATREAIDEAGWFHTGDIGLMEDGFLRITDRKKDIIVTAGGKNVAPQNLESALKTACPLVSQVVVVGDRRPYLVALVTLSEENVVPWARERGLAGSYAELAEHAEVRHAIDAAIQDLNTRLASYETIKQWRVLARDFSQETGELTPTLKVKRKFAGEKYRDAIESMYA